MLKLSPNPLNSICVFCGSAPGHDPEFMRVAEELGHSMAKAGIRLIYGGGNSGLMGQVARASLASGGEVHGIIPHFLKTREHMLEGAHKMEIVPDMHTRKRLMFEAADAFVALPGGIGTLEELFEQLTWVQLQQHKKPVLIANINGFWDRLLDLMAHVREEGFVREGLTPRFLVTNDVEAIVPMLQAEMRALVD